jgi:peptide deformylase
MNVLEVKKHPEKILRIDCQAVEHVRAREKTLFHQMVLTMHHFNGIGLAAPQVGLAERIIVADIGDGAIALANPVIVKRAGTDEMAEGCLSVEDIQVKISRSYEIVVQGLNQHNEKQEIKMRGLMARVLQHEIDHLNGKLIIDYLPSWRTSDDMKR